MAFQADPSAGTAVPHVCPQCSKSFARLCDLNKHAKSHSRPYKCKDPECKYNTLGWPTAKELERHYNDKHSATPRTFPCLFQPCSYWSKRESNCKQHMEKAHNWKYVRSKSKGKRSVGQPRAGASGYSPNDGGMVAEADHSTSPVSASPQSLLLHSGDVDFVLYGDDQADALGDEDDPVGGPYYGDAESAQSYLPWTSPMTRLRKNESIIESFSQTYNGNQENINTVASSRAAELDPVLSNFTLHGLHHCPPADDHGRFVDHVAIKVESPVLAIDPAFPRKRKREPVDAPSTGPKQGAASASGVGPLSSSRKAGPGQGAPTPSKARGPSKYGDSSGDDGCPPAKKLKPSSAKDFTDTSMPDIFRHAHPHIYDRDRADRYSPCHTVHREISTLVRHLSRPAHRLKVTERIVSSFDVEDPDFRHPRAGVCRICWQTFNHRPAFDAHISRPCQKVSKGKREKWRVLFDSFTPLHDLTDTTLSSQDSAQQQIDEAWETFSSQQNDVSLVRHDNNDTFLEAETPPTSVPSPVVFQSADSGPGAGQSVSAGEHDRLQREHQALRERHQQLERMTQALLIQRIFQDSMKHATAHQPDAKPPAPSSGRPGRWPAMSDRDSLVGHMDSQSTDVDVHAFMEEMEDTRQTLSRMDSGLSTASRSTIHHVPPSPPSQRAELPYPINDGDPAHTQQPKHSLAHRPPLPSIPDSGYGTENRRGSLGDLPFGATGQQQQQPPPLDIIGAKLLTPPSTAEAANAGEDKRPHEDFPWGAGGEGGGEDSPFHQAGGPGANTLSPPRHSQPGFLVDQEMMADYGDDSFNIFYQDNTLASRSSPLDFTFEYPSQID